MAKSYYQTTKVVKVTDEKKVVVRSPGLAGPKGDAGTTVLTGPGIPSSLVGKVGDLYIDTNSKITYGPKTINGWPTQPLFEMFNRDLLGQVFNIGVASDTWEIEHGLGYNPNATTISSDGTVIEGDISYPDENTIVIRFIGVTTGKAYLS